MDFNELKELVINKLKDYPEYKDRAIKELRRAKWLFENDNINIADELLNSDKEIDDRYVLPFFLGKTTKVDLSKPLETVQVREGGGGGLDIDTDYEPKAKEFIKKWLIEELGQDKVMGVGTYTTVGLASGIKDILRKCDVPFKESNDFCKELNNEISFEENMEYYKNNFPDLYKTYERYQAYLDFTPKIMNGVKNCGQHAGGVLILDKPVWNYIPVIHTKDGVASAFVENGSNTELDEMNLTKLDCLSISVLEVISNAIDSIDEELILIEDEDGVVKIVGSSYLKNKETEV
jgi:hypothetical protein